MSTLKIHIPNQISEQIREALVKCGERECGGILMGEHLGEEEFRVVDLTVEMKAGTISRFMRAVTHFVSKLAAFFDRTGHRYKVYNYLGEWHSHPLFELRPSQHDYQSMRDIIDDPEVGANFVVLMIVKLNDGNVESRAWSLVPGGGNSTFDASVFSRLDARAGGVYFP